jgi:predicted polyphosphate/ATP-dependent NAD kinase
MVFMALIKFGFIVTGAGLDPAIHRQVMSSGTFEMVSVGVSTPAEAIPIAREMVASGVQLLELCGGFGPLWTAKVLEAIEQRIPVGAVGYGPESIDAMHRLFAPS